jgi:hypothetical protein
MNQPRPTGCPEFHFPAQNYPTPPWQPLTEELARVKLEARTRILSIKAAAGFSRMASRRQSHPNFEAAISMPKEDQECGRDEQ